MNKDLSGSGPVGEFTVIGLYSEVDFRRAEHV